MVSVSFNGSVVEISDAKNLRELHIKACLYFDLDSASHGFDGKDSDMLQACKTYELKLINLIELKKQLMSLLIKHTDSVMALNMAYGLITKKIKGKMDGYKQLTLVARYVGACNDAAMLQDLIYLLK